MSNESIKALDLTKLLDGMPELDDDCVRKFAKCCSICLDGNNHQKGLELKAVLEIDDMPAPKFAIIDWVDLEEKTKRSIKNKKEAAEEGACGVAGLLIFELTNYQLIEQGVTFEGIDYWLGMKEFDDLLPFKKEARLEVSGIFKATASNSIQARIKKKENQIKQSDSSRLPAYIVIMDFGKPEVYVGKR